MAGKHEERRAHRRVEAREVAGHIIGHAGHATISLETHNISCSGLYCRVPMYIPPFTRLRVSVFLPIREGEVRRKTLIQFDGVVVRTEPQVNSPDVKEYHLAVFFEGLSEEARSLVARYVEQA